MEHIFYDQNAMLPYEDTEEDQDRQQQEFGCFDINPVYSPAQIKPKKKHSLVPFELDLEPAYKRKPHQPVQPSSKKVCMESSIQDETNHNQTDTSQNTEQEVDSSELDHPFCELDLLCHSIGLESLKIKHIPSAQEVADHWNKLNPTYSYTNNQDQFLSRFLPEDQLMKIKFALDEDIVSGPQTKEFQNWVEGICSKDNAQLIKEMARRQKVCRYLEKKHSRTFCKKVHYQIRQRVAEERLRVKGRFVTWTQALDMLNENSNKKQYNAKDYYKVKKELKEKFSSRRVKL